MADVASVDLRQIQNKLLEWELPEKSLAPLSLSQRNAIYEISDEVGKRNVPENVSKYFVINQGRLVMLHCLLPELFRIPCVVYMSHC